MNTTNKPETHANAISNQSVLPFWRRLSTHLNLYNFTFSLLFVVLSVAIAFNNSRQAILNDTYNLLSSINLNKVNHFESWILNQEESNQFFAARPQMREFTEKLVVCLENGWDCRAIEERLLQGHLRVKVAIDGNFDDFFIIRASDGMVITGTDTSHIGKFREHTTFFMEGLEGNFTETATYDVAAGKAEMHTTTPIYAPGGKVIAVLSGHLNLEKMVAIIQHSSGLSQTEDSYLVNKFNYFLTEPYNGDNYALRRTVFSEGVRDCLTGNSDVAEYTDYRGVTVLGAYQWLPQYEVCMLSEKDRAEVFAPIFTMRNQFIVVGAILFSASIVFGYFLSHRITNPLQDLNQAAKQFGAGNLSTRVNIHSNNEIGVLSATFNQMAANIENLQSQNENLVTELTKLNKELEARVENRTRDLKKARLAAEKNLKDLQQEMIHRQRAQKDLAQKARDLQQSNEDLQQFAYVASHDLQEPLRMVASYLQLLEQRYQDQLDDDAHDFISYAVDGATRMRTLINDLLDFSRVGTRESSFEPTDLNAVLGKARANLHMRIEEAGAMVVSDELPTLPADPPQMVQLFQNLIDNAIKFRAQEPPRVHISAEEQTDEWIISLSDNGIGIDPQYFERIFIIFQRLHTRQEYPGTGIGLAITRRIIERHNGRVWVTSEPGHGTTFHVALPKQQKELHNNIETGADQ
jgi:signal transduction histidine kinase